MKLHALLLVAALAGCATTPPPVQVKLVDRVVETAIPIDPALTRAVPKPARPAAKCKDEKGRPTICNKQLGEWINAYDAAFDKLAAKLQAILALQPDAPPK